MDLQSIVQTYLKSLEEFSRVGSDDVELTRIAIIELSRAQDLAWKLEKHAQLAGQAATEDLPLPEVHGDIVETLSCVITDDNINEVSLAGEIAIRDVNWGHQGEASRGDLYVSFSNVNALQVNERVLENVHHVTGNVYKLNSAVDWSARDVRETSSLVAAYRVTNLPQVQCPILVTPVWQFKETETISMVNLRPLISVNYTLLKVHINIGTDAHDILSKPAGFYNKLEGTIQWDLPSLEEDMILILRYKGGKTSSVTTGSLKQPEVCVDFTASQLLTQVKLEYGRTPSCGTNLPLNQMTISGNYKAQC